jgi:hypothetical protein
MFLQRRERQRSGIERAPPRAFPSHRAWVRGFQCVCFKTGECEGPIEAAHLRLGVPASEAGGTGLKPHDKWTYPACEKHHDEQHTIGEASFQKKYELDLRVVCMKLARISPHRKKWQ